MCVCVCVFFSMVNLAKLKYFKSFIVSLVNPFQPNVPFLYPLKTSENQRLKKWFSDVFWGYKNGLKNWVKQ